MAVAFVSWWTRISLKNSRKSTDGSAQRYSNISIHTVNCCATLLVCTKKIWNLFDFVSHAHQTCTKAPTRPCSVNVYVQQPLLRGLLNRVWANSGGMRPSPHYVFGLSHSRSSQTAAACINGACLYTLQGALCHYVQCYTNRQTQPYGSLSKHCWNSYLNCISLVLFLCSYS